MTVYRKCRLCLKRDGCSIKSDLGKAIAGLGITSLIHRCDSYEPLFKPGDPVLVTTLADCNGADSAIFPGHFLGQTADRKAHVYVEPDIEDIGGNHLEFTPRSNGYCTLSYSRVAANPDGTAIQVCEKCNDVSMKCRCYDGGLTENAFSAVPFRTIWGQKNDCKADDA